MRTAQAIPILLSRAALLGETSSSVNLPIHDTGTTYSMAQQTRWLDDKSFAIGRWDGSLTIFHRPLEGNGGPIISTASASWAGLQMITRLSDTVFATSNNEDSIALWAAPSGYEKGVTLRGFLRYDPAYGVANDGTVSAVAGTHFFASGHSEGYLLIWQLADPPEKSTLRACVDLRSPEPVPSPYRLWNIRSVESWLPGTVVTGSEDGDVCLVAVLDGAIRARMRYNPTAQRGINDLAVYEDYLLLANCSVGNSDRNLWLYRLRPDAPPTQLHAVNLRLDPTLPQVFNFCVDLACDGATLYVFATTQEGVAWVGTVVQNTLIPLGTERVSSSLGAALSFRRSTRVLSVVGDNIHLFALV